MLFKVTDPTGFPVSLSSERYNHILVDSGHTEVSPSNIARTIENPELIYKGNIQDTRWYFARGNSTIPALYTFVAVAEYEDEGDVRTAYVRRDIPTNNGGCIYVNVNNKL